MHYSQYFKIRHSDFVRSGVFNGFIEMDSPLHIDPMLLKNCTIPEFIGAYDRFLSYFNEIVVLADNVQVENKGDRCFRQIVRKLQFPEIVSTGLGYSRTGTRGSGINGKLTIQLALSIVEIVKAGIKDPVFFTLLPFIEEGIGADRISDMTIYILLMGFLTYTQRVAKELCIRTSPCRANGELFLLPTIKRRPYLFIPQQFLTYLPLAKSREDIDNVCHYNRVLREKICKAIGISWADFEKMRKRRRKAAILSHIGLYEDIMQFYKPLEGVPYDFAADDRYQYADIKVKEDIVEKYPLDLHEFSATSTVDVLNVTHLICNQYKRLVEQNHMYWLLYNDDHTFRDEKAAQYLFYTVAHSYCEANNIDLNRECDPGVGELDFKLSQGYNHKVVIEMKKASNPKLYSGFSKQLPTYKKAESAANCIYLIIRDTDKADSTINNLYKQRQEILNSGKYCPELFVVDATEKPSASRL